MTRSACAPFAAVLLLAAGPAGAHFPEADRPNEHGKPTMADATPVGEGALEVSLGWAPSWNLTGRGEFERSAPGHTQPLALGVTYGVTEDVDVSATVAWGFTSQSRYDFDPADGIAGSAWGRGLADAAVSARWRFLCSGWLDLAAVGTLVAPVGLQAHPDHPGLSQGFWSGQLALVGSLDAGPFTANLEGGASLPLSGAGTDVGMGYLAVGTGLQLLDWLQPTLEVAYQHAIESPGPDAALLTVTVGAVLPLGGGYGAALGVQHAAWGRNTGQFTAATLMVKRSF